MDYDKFKHRQLRRNNKQSTIKIATHYTTNLQRLVSFPCTWKYEAFPVIERCVGETITDRQE